MQRDTQAEMKPRPPGCGQTGSYCRATQNAGTSNPSNGAEKAGTAAVVAAGTAALGTALAEIAPDRTDSEKATEEPK
jgi:hypothetical protein